MISSTLRRRRRNVGNAAEFKNHPSLLHCTNEYDAVVNQLPYCTDLSVTDPAEENRDLISQLPDNILIKILGCLDTSCATSTSILSTRWRNLYKQVPDIDLNCSDLLRRAQTSWTNLLVSKIERGICYVLGCEYTNQIPHDYGLIVDSLDRFLSLHSGSQLHTARLNCCLDESVSTRFEQCIYSLGRLGIEKLVLCCSCRRLIPDVLHFSSQILVNMPSLKYLELGRCSLMPSLRSQCNSLQNLVLSEVTLPHGALEDILSNCSSLHALTIADCNTWSSKLTIRGPNLQLKYLEISSRDNVNEIELYASNLVVFEFTTCGMVNFIFDHVPQLQTVYLSMDEEHIIHYVCGKLAEDVPHLKSLSFYCAVCCFQDSSILTGMNSFSNLRRLDLTVDSTTGKNDLLLLVPLLQSCSLLEEFHLHTFLSGYNRPAQVKKLDIVFHSELKKVEIGGFVGRENDIEFALYILQSSIKLEEMHITKCRKIYTGFRRWIPPEHEQTVWSEERHNTILMRLQGQAVSRMAQLIIEHKAQDYKPTKPIEEEFFDYA